MPMAHGGIPPVQPSGKLTPEGLFQPLILMLGIPFFLTMMRLEDVVSTTLTMRNAESQVHNVYPATGRTP
jgi:hypothetical protein